MMTQKPDFLPVALAVVLLGFVTVYLRSRQRQQQLPGYISHKEDVGALMKSAAMEKRAPWEVFDMLAKKYGSLRQFPRSILLLPF